MGYYAPNVPLPSLVAIDAVPSLAKGTLVRVVAIVTDMGDVASKWNEAKAAETWRRTLTIADESHHSITLTVFGWDEQTDASLGGIISVKARTDDFLGVPQLKASLKDVDFAASIPEAHALHAHWLRESPEVTPLRRRASVQPIASIAFTDGRMRLCSSSARIAASPLAVFEGAAAGLGGASLSAKPTPSTNARIISVRRCITQPALIAVQLCCIIAALAASVDVR